MRNWLLGVGIGLVGSFIFVPALAQTTEDTSGPPSASQLAQIENCREGIVDPQARPEDRQRWIETLLAFDSDAARQLVARLIVYGENPDAQRAVCAGIARQARETPDRMVAAYVEPLLNVLGAEREDVRAAAVQALADFPDAQVPEKLQAIAGSPGAPVMKRLAAIDALGLEVEDRDVVDGLVVLLDADVPEITARVINVLRPLSNEEIGTDVDRWRQWWARKSELSKEAWLADQLHMNRDRHRTLTRRFDAYQTEAELRQQAITARLGDFQREIFRALSDDEKEAKLAAWLADPLADVQRTALAIIRARIADEGRRPMGAVLQAVLRLLDEGAAPIRREALTILQNLNDTVVVDAVLARLDRETDPTTRLTVFKAIGKLNDPRAIPRLVEVIASPDQARDCVREAAIALGQVAGERRDEPPATGAVPALKTRYQAVPPEDGPLRAALLTAMAGMARADFEPEFLDAIESDDAALLRPAIRGLGAVPTAARMKLPRLRSLTAHPDQLVRLAAIETVGELGGEDADMESVLTRLNATIEASEAVREAAWRAFRELMSAKPLAQQAEAAERLRKIPDLEVRYLTALAETLATDASASPNIRESVHGRLATLLAEQGKYSDAVPYFREVYVLRTERGDADALSAGLRWLEVALLANGAPRAQRAVEALAAAADPDTKSQLIDIVGAYLDELCESDDPARARALLEDLRQVPGTLFDERWTQLLEETERRLEFDDEASPSDSTS